MVSPSDAQPIHPFFAAQLCASSIANLYQFEFMKAFYPEPYRRQFEQLFQSVQEDREAFDHAVKEESLNRFFTYLKGLQRYYMVPPKAPDNFDSVLAQKGNATLRDYGQKYSVSSKAKPVLFIPSLINRAHIFDLIKGRSLFAYMAEEGFRPLLIDWGTLGEEEREFTLSDYIHQRLLPLIDSAFELIKEPMPVIGYCMGGLFALSAVLKRKDITGLGLMAVPWDFHGEDIGLHSLMRQFYSLILDQIEQAGLLAPEFLQYYFFLLNPLNILKKFRDFANIQSDSQKMADFKALEHWANDGVPLAKEVAKECLQEWYINNSLFREKKLAGEFIDLKSLEVPRFVSIPRNDVIVSERSAMALLSDLPKETNVISPSLGHVGMIIAHQAKNQVWSPLASWLNKL